MVLARLNSWRCGNKLTLWDIISQEDRYLTTCRKGVHILQTMLLHPVFKSPSHNIDKTLNKRMFLSYIAQKWEIIYNNQLTLKSLQFFSFRNFLLDFCRETPYAKNLCGKNCNDDCKCTGECRERPRTNDIRVDLEITEHAVHLLQSGDHDGQMEQLMTVKEVVAHSMFEAVGNVWSVN